MPPSSIGTNVHQSLDVHSLNPAQVTLHFICVLDDLSQCSDLGITEILDASVGIDACGGQNLL
jgi:hypothetical protein